jgi:flagellar hook-basal body complex protein FliE
MRVEPLIPDVAISAQSAPAQSSQFSKVLDDLGAVLNRAESAENAFAVGTGSLSSAIYERARADVVLSVATAAAQRTAQGLQSILNMQV